MKLLYSNCIHLVYYISSANKKKIVIAVIFVYGAKTEFILTMVVISHGKYRQVY